jgi:hypothetical protein
VRPAFIPQTAYIHPRVTGDKVRYFEWMGSAIYTADHRAGSMHGKQFLLDAVYAGIDATYVYGRLDFNGDLPKTDFELVVNLESWAGSETRPRRALRLEAAVQQGRIRGWTVEGGTEERVLASSTHPDDAAKLALLRNFEFKLPLVWLLANPATGTGATASDLRPTSPIAAATKLRLRFSLWQNRLPVDALPLEGWIELQLLSEGDLLYAVG